MICNVFKRSLKSQILLAQSLKNCLTQADPHLLWALALLRCSPSFLGKAPPSLMLSVASDVHLGNLSPLVAISTQHTHFKVSAIQRNFQHQRDHPFGDPKVWSLRVFHGHQQPLVSQPPFCKLNMGSRPNEETSIRTASPATVTEALHFGQQQFTVSILSASSCNLGRLACHPWRLVPELRQKLGREISR